jgi:integrase
MVNMRRSVCRLFASRLPGMGEDHLKNSQVKAAKPITVRAVDALKPGDFLWDGGNEGVSGFHIRCRDKSKVYGLAARISGRQRWLRIGEHGHYTPDTARKEARRLLGTISSGGDPASEREKAKRTLTVADVASRFLAEHCGVPDFSVKTFKVAPGAPLKPGSARQHWHLLKRYVVPKLGKLRADAVTTLDIAKLHHEMRSTPRAANHMLSCVSAMSNWATRRGLWPKGSNPCEGIKRFEEKSHERFLKPTEVHALGKVLSMLDAEIEAAAVGEVERESKHANKAQARVSPYAVAAVRLLTFTGMRPIEVLTLQWEHVDFENRVINLKDAKTGDRQVTLGTAALQTLSNIPAIEGNPYVIVGDREGGHVASLQRVWAIIRKEAGIEDVRLYDLRHSYASTLAKGGAPVYEIQALLGHRNITTSMRYVHLANDQVRSAADKANAAIEAAMNMGADTTKNVVAMRGKGGR